MIGYVTFVIVFVAGYICTDLVRTYLLIARSTQRLDGWPSCVHCGAVSAAQWVGVCPECILEREDTARVAGVLVDPYADEQVRDEAD